MEAGPDGFPVGTWTKDRETVHESWGKLYRFEGRNSVGCYVGSLTGVAETFVAPAVPFERLLEGVTLADAVSPLERGAAVDARAEAVPLRDGTPEAVSRAVPVRVKVTLAGYRPLEYEFRLDEPVEPRVMEREGE